MNNIPNDILDFCSSLTQIIFAIPSFVTSIGSSAFYTCKSFMQIIIPSSVTKIGEGIFHNCSKLANIIINSYKKSCLQYFENKILSPLL